MPNSPHSVRLLAVFLTFLLPSAAFAQAPHKVIRTPTDVVLVNYDQTIAAAAGITAVLMTPTDSGSKSTSITGQILDAHTVRFDLKAAEAALVNASAADKRRPFMLIERLVVDDEAVTDLMAVIPTELKFSLEGLVANRTELAALYLTVADATRIQQRNKSDWQIVINNATPIFPDEVEISDPARGEESGFEFTVRLILRRFITNGADVVVNYRPSDGAAYTQVAKGKTLAGPKKVDDDPVGDADIYLGFTYTASRGDNTTHVGGLQAHIERPLASWWAGKRHVLSVVPAFTALVHAKELDDEDSMSLKSTFEWEAMFGNLDRTPDLDRLGRAPLFPNVRTSFGGGWEFSKGFKEGNVVGEGQVAPAFHVFGKTFAKPHPLKGYKLIVSPSAGFEAGRVVESTINDLVDSTIKRLKAWLGAKLVFEFRNKSYLDALVFEGSYVGRKLFSEEQYVDVTKTKLAAGPATAEDGSIIKVEAGTLVRNVAMGVDKKARQYGIFAARLAFTTNFEAFVTYARGSLPPKFEHVNKFEAGFAFRYNAGY